MPLLSQADIKNLDSYKYSGSDFSLCSRFFMQKYWSSVVEMVPRTVAPNMLTLLGFIVSTSTSLLTLYFFVYANGVLPNWLWVWAAVSLFAYQTLDAIDGKQARRTGCGSPLGELFDHGCDALFTPLLCVTTCLSMNYDPWQSFIHCTAISTTLFFSLFEQYVTGTLDLGYINGPVEGILMSCGSFLFTAVVGPQWWSTPFAKPLYIVEVTKSFTLTLAKPHDVILVFGVVMAAGTALFNLLHAFTMSKAHDKIRRFQVLLVPLTVLGVMVFTVRAQPALITASRFPFGLELAYGWFISYTVTRMTVSRLCKTDYNPVTVPFIILLVAFAAQHVVMLPLPAEVIAPQHLVFLRKLRTLVFIGVALMTLLAYLKMIVGVFQQFARHLKINILTMTPVQKVLSIRKGQEAVAAATKSH